MGQPDFSLLLQGTVKGMISIFLSGSQEWGKQQNRKKKKNIYHFFFLFRAAIEDHENKSDNEKTWFYVLKTELYELQPDFKLNSKVYFGTLHIKRIVTQKNIVEQSAM